MTIIETPISANCFGCPIHCSVEKANPGGAIIATNCPDQDYADQMLEIAGKASLALDPNPSPVVVELNNDDQQ